MTIAQITDAFNNQVLNSAPLELQCLYSITQMEGAFDQVDGEICEDLFYYQQNKLICRAIMDLATTGKKYDLAMVLDWLTSRHLLKDMGGEKYLVEILSKTQFTQDVRDHVLRLKEYATRREIEKALESSLKAIRIDKHLDTSELAQSVSKTILDASSGYFGSDSFVGAAAGVVSTIERIISADARGVPTGFIGLDNQIGGIQKGDLVIIAGESSGGKSLLGVNIAVNLMDETKKPVLCFSMEMTVEQVTKRILSSLSSVSQNKLKMGTYTAEEWARFQHVSDIWATRPFYIAKGGQTVESITAKTKKKFRELGGLACVLVDYIQLMKAEKSVGRTGDIDHITRSLKALALDLDIPVIALSQYRRTGDKKPTISDLRDSSSIEQDANTVIMINHEDQYSELIIGKQREGQRNISSRIVMNGELGRFENPLY